MEACVRESECPTQSLPCQLFSLLSFSLFFLPLSLSLSLSLSCSGIVSLISLAVLSYERYCTMMGATQADNTNYRKVAGGIVFSWVYSLAWSVPPLLGWSRYGPEGPGTTCSVNWAAKTVNNVSYIVCLFIFCLILPFAVIVYSYGKLLQAIKQVGSNRQTLHCCVYSIQLHSISFI